MALTDIRKKLIDKKVIDITGDINVETRIYVREALQFLFSEGSPVVTVTINSAGGNADVGLDISDLIQFYPGQSIGVALVAAGSAACTILQSCDWRVSTPNGHILIHHTNFEISWDVLNDNEKLEKFRESKKRFFNSKELLAKRTNRNVEEIMRKCDDNKWISAREALEFGLLDEIVESAEKISFPEKEEGIT